MGLNTWKHGNKLDEKAWNSPNAKPSLWISMVWSPVPALEELFNQLWCIREILGTRCCVGSSTSLRHAANLPKRCTVWDFDIFEVSNNAGTITDMMTWCIQLHALLLYFSAIWCPTCQVQPWYYASRTTELKGSIPWTSTTELQGQIQLKAESVLSLSDSKISGLAEANDKHVLVLAEKNRPRTASMFFGRNSPTLTYNCWWGRMITWYHMWTRKMVAWCLGPVNIT